MTNHPIFTKSLDDVSYSVASLNGLNHVYAIAVPRGGDTLRQQFKEAQETIMGIMSQEGAGQGIVQQTIFLAEDRLIPDCRRFVREFFGSAQPSVSYVPQPPCSGKLVAIEALGLCSPHAEREDYTQKVTVQRVNDQFVVARHQGIDWIYASQAVPTTSTPGVYDKSACALQHLRRMLCDTKVNFGHIVRAWFYLGGIVDPEGPRQRYQEFNRARTDFYQGVPFLTDLVPAGHVGQNFPASTGIGTSGHGIYLSAIALASQRPDILAVPLQNPRQMAACDYGTDYGPQSPKFARGLAVSWDRDSILFISGTASITHSETRHPEDVRAQVNETLDNINTLISEENLDRHGLPGAGTDLGGLGLLRVYVKRSEDYATIRNACETRLGRLPTIYTLANVCRPDLLVEIEGIAFARNSSPSISSSGKRNLRAACQASNGECFPCCPETCQERSQCPAAHLA